MGMRGDFANQKKLTKLKRRTRGEERQGEESGEREKGERR